MFDVIHKHKSDHMFFAAVKLDGEHNVYLSAYGSLASALLEKYIGEQRADNEELFAEWDESLQKAAAQVGTSITHAIEDGHVYISSFQNGIGISEEDEDGPQKDISQASG